MQSSGALQVSGEGQLWEELVRYKGSQNQIERIF
jgi:hypothetical protein